MLKVLVVDDDQGLRLSVRSVLQATGRFEIEEAFDGLNALERFRVAAVKPQIVILDVDMPRVGGLQALRQIKESDPATTVLMLTAHATLADAVQAVKDGAFNYLSKPVDGAELVAVLEKAIQAHTLISNIAASSPVMVEAGRKIVGNTSQMQKVFNIIHKLAKVDTPVLIRGASGTGKELVAKAIHFNSARKEGKFVAINCSAIPENLFESELFGHEKGSFTGAHERKLGKFQFAEGGTLFLDEVGDMPPLMQVKILRVLQEKLFTPVGSNREIASNVRIIAATNRPLEEMIKASTFREDLFYRLNVVPIFLPALAQRKDDIERLIYIFLKKFNEVHVQKLTGISSEALGLLKRYEWPGNIRELENVIEHSFVVSTSNQITLSSLPEAVLTACGIDLGKIDEESATASVLLTDDDVNSEFIDDADDEEETLVVESGVDGPLDFNVQKEAFEKDFIIKALKTFRGRINQTAMHANIPKKTLLRKIEKYGINAKDYI